MARSYPEDPQERADRLNAGADPDWGFWRVAALILSIEAVLAVCLAIGQGWMGWSDLWPF